MRDAKIRRTGEIVTAEKASRYGKYCCRLCNSEVFLKAGQHRERHFAHMPGQGKPECADYHQIENLRRQWEPPLTRQPTEKVAGLLLSIELEPDHDAHRNLRRWGLRLTVPKSYGPHGEVAIDIGDGDVRRVSLGKLCFNSQTYPANPNAAEFGARWVSPEVRPDYREAVEHRIAGLNPVGVTVFDVVPQKLKPRSNGLQWGQSYYFVWRADRISKVPSALMHHALADNRNWSCHLIALPERTDADVVMWLEEVCDLRISPARREWGLIYPAPYGMEDEGYLQIHPTTTMLLGIKSVDEDGEITCTSRESLSLQLSGSGRHVIEIDIGWQETRRLIHLFWDSFPLNSIATQSYFEFVPEPTVVVEVGVLPDKAHLALHHASCHARLMSVRMTKEQILGMHADSRLKGKLRFRPANSFEWQSEDLTFERTEAVDGIGQTSLPIPQIGRINGLLKNRSLDVEIDFGPYGGFYASAQPVEEITPSSVRIPSRLRARIEWLCKASYAFVDAERRVVDSLDDAALVRHLRTLKKPLALLSNRRALERDLQRIGCGKLPI